CARDRPPAPSTSGAARETAAAPRRRRGRPATPPRRAGPRSRRQGWGLAFAAGLAAALGLAGLDQAGGRRAGAPAVGEGWGAAGRAGGGRAPHSMRTDVITMGVIGTFSFCPFVVVCTVAILSTTSMPSSTSPNTA